MSKSQRVESVPMDSPADRLMTPRERRRGTSRFCDVCGATESSHRDHNHNHEFKLAQSARDFDRRAAEYDDALAARRAEKVQKLAQLFRGVVAGIVSLREPMSPSVESSDIAGDSTEVATPRLPDSFTDAEIIRVGLQAHDLATRSDSTQLS